MTTNEELIARARETASAIRDNMAVGVGDADRIDRLADALAAVSDTPSEGEREVYLVTIKLPKNSNHDPKAKLTDSCAVSENCTDSTGEHHTYLAKSIEEVQRETRHITRIETVTLATPAPVDDIDLAVERSETIAWLVDLGVERRGAERSIDGLIVTARAASSVPVDREKLEDRVADTLAYYQCRETNPKADHPRMGYHAFSEDQREHLKSQKREAAAEIARMVLSASPARLEEADEDDEPCEAETHSWSHYRPEQIDSYWIRCTRIGKHDEHYDSNTGLRWGDLPVGGGEGGK